MSADTVKALKEVMWAAREYGLPPRYAQMTHDAIHDVVRLRAEVDAERALADQLAAALRDAHGIATRHAVCWCSTDSEYPSDCDSTIALAAYEAARKEEQ